MELDLQSLFGLLCTAVLIGWEPEAPPAFGHMYDGAIGQPKIDDISLWHPDGKDQISEKEASECRRHMPVGEGEVILDDVAAVQAGVGVRPLLRRESTQQQKMQVTMWNLYRRNVAVRPDWICMRVVPLDRPWKGHQLLKVLDFLISVLIFEKTSKFWAASYEKMPLILLLVRITVFIILSSYWLVHFYLMKKSAKVLHHLGLDCGMLEFFNHEP